MGIFFVPNSEKPQRQGDLLFRSADGTYQANVHVKIIGPDNFSSSPARKDGNVPQNAKTKYAEEIDQLQYLVKQLKGKLYQNELLINRLKDEMRKKDLQLATFTAPKDGKPAEIDLPRYRFPALSQKSKNDSSYEDMYKLLLQSLDKEIQKNKIQITRSDHRLYITLAGDITFPSGETYLTKQGLLVLQKISSILKTHFSAENRITVVGHTDAFPIKKNARKRYPSNWELSSIRAAAVVRNMQFFTGIKGKYWAATGYSFYHPLSDNKTLKGRTQNRRIDIVISTTTGVK